MLELLGRSRSGRIRYLGTLCHFSCILRAPASAVRDVDVGLSMDSVATEVRAGPAAGGVWRGGHARLDFAVVDDGDRCVPHIPQRMFSAMSMRILTAGRGGDPLLMHPADSD